jgi:hypothetical protein
LEFRIVSGDPSGLYAVSGRLTANEAVSLFLTIATASFAKHIDNRVMTELTLNEWTADPTPDMIYVGDRRGWMVGLAPAYPEDRMPSAN